VPGDTRGYAWRVGRRRSRRRCPRAPTNHGQTNATDGHPDRTPDEDQRTDCGTDCGTHAPAFDADQCTDSCVNANTVIDSNGDEDPIRRAPTAHQHARAASAPAIDRDGYASAEIQLVVVVIV
jgi:hypothetical protein